MHSETLSKNLSRVLSTTRKSKALYERAQEVIPGGISANAKFVPPYPLSFKTGKGSRVTDVDDNVYIDYVMGYGPLILGHSHPDVLEAFESLVRDYGTYFFGAPTQVELELAEKICRLVPCAEMVRFTNSGNEATLLAARLARAYTKKTKMGRFEGHYHGWNDLACISYSPPLDKVGAENRPSSVPQSAGLPPEALNETIVLPFNNVDGLYKLVEQHREDLAGIIVEPVSKAYLPAESEFMKALREVTTKYGIVLIFDEVITGMRLGLSGAQGYYRVEPELAAMGKIIGGGFPVGAVAGSGEIMKLLSPISGEVFHSGTFNGHPAAMAAGLKTLEILETTDAYQRANSAGEALRRGLNEIAADRNVEAQSFGIASTFHILFTKNEVKCHRDAMRSDMDKLLAYDYGMWSRGVNLIPRHAGYASAAHSRDDVDKTLQAAAEVIRELE